jgi:hypothetical protein
MQAIDWQQSRNVLAAIGVPNMLLQFIKWAG